MHTTYSRTHPYARPYPGCASKQALADKLANGLLCAASTLGVIAALFFLLTL